MQRQMPFKTVHRIGRVCHQNIERVWLYSFLRIILQPVAKDNVASSGSIHEHGDLRDTCQTIVFLHSINMFLHPIVFLVGTDGIDSLYSLGKEMPGTTRIVNNTWQIMLRNIIGKRQRIPNKTSNGRRCKKLSLVLFKAFIE